MPEHPILKDVPDNLVAALKRRGWDLAQILGDAQQLHGAFEHGRRKYHNDMNVTDALRVPVQFVIDLVEVLADMGREIGRLETDLGIRRWYEEQIDKVPFDHSLKRFASDMLARMPVQHLASDMPPATLRTLAEYCEGDAELCARLNELYQETAAELIPTVEWDKPLESDMTPAEALARLESGEGIPKRIGPCGPSGYDVPRREPDLTEHDLMAETHHRMLWLDGPRDAIRVDDVDEATQAALREILDEEWFDSDLLLFGSEPYRVTVRWTDLLGEVCESSFNSFAVTLPHRGSFAVYIEADKIKESGIPGIFARQAPAISEENRLDVIVRDMTTSDIVFHAPACWHRCSDGASYPSSVVIGFEYILGAGELCTLYDDAHGDASKRFHLDGCALWPKRFVYPETARGIVERPGTPRHIEIHAGELRLYFASNSIEDHMLGDWFRERIESQEVLGALHPEGYVFEPDSLYGPGPCDVKLLCRIKSWAKGEEENCLTLELLGWRHWEDEFEAENQG